MTEHVNEPGRLLAEEARALLAAIVDSSEDAIISKDLDGVVSSWNAAAERLFGYTASEAIGKSILTLIIPPERDGEEAMILGRLRRGERIEHFETERMTKDGRRVPISLTVSPVRNSDGAIIGASKIARDISERLRGEAERERLLDAEQAARKEAETASRAKDEFVAMISHEIRSPVNAILGWAQRLRQTPVDAAAMSRAIESIERSARAQAQLIDDLLDMSRAIAGKLQLQTRLVDVRQSLEAAIELMRPAAEAKGIAIEVSLEARRTPVTGDADRLQQIFLNVLSNAVKFTPGSGRISVALRRMESHAEITVSDSGAGIAADFLPHVFDRFAQANGTTSRRDGGLGLGLAIVRQLVELHGGSVSAASDGDGHGATFAVRLPLCAVQGEGDGLRLLAASG